MIRRYLVALLLSGSLGLSGVAIAAASSGHHTPASSASTTTAAAHAATAPTKVRQTGSRFGGRQGGHSGFGGQRLTVKSVSGSTITATGWGGKTITVEVNATTVYTEAGAIAVAADVQPGSVISVRSATPSAGATTITATTVIIMLPRIGGTVTSLNGSTMTVRAFNGTAYTVLVTGQTTYTKANVSATLSAVTPHTFISAEGTLSSDGKTMTATRVTIFPVGTGGTGANGHRGGSGRPHAGHSGTMTKATL